MLRALRRSRLLAFVLLAASPAAAGTILPAVHPCPVDMPWLAQGTATGGHAGHHQDAGKPAQESHSCTCISSSLFGSAVNPPVPHELDVAIVSTFLPVLVGSSDSSLELSPTAVLLPPATAPPLL